MPSLDLKRQQLLAAWKGSRRVLREKEQEIAKFQESLERLLPLLGSSTLGNRDLSGLIRVRRVDVEEGNVVGIRVPVDCRVELERAEYSTLALPFWVDQLVESLAEGARLQLERQAWQVRTDRLAAAARKITQRVNLFEKILIPTALKNIQRISIALSDEGRAAVVRSKLAKAKRHRA